MPGPLETLLAPSSLGVSYRLRGSGYPSLVRVRGYHRSPGQNKRGETLGLCKADDEAKISNFEAEETDSHFGPSSLVSVCFWKCRNLAFLS
jgi:hypothetical protein